MKKNLAKAFGGGAGILLAGLLAVTSLNMPPVRAAEGSGATGLNVTYHTQQEILDRMNSDAAVTGAGLSFSENPVTASPYAPGTLSQETLNGAVTMLNQIRFIAGLQDNVALDDSYNQMTQAASLVNYVNNVLTHTPAQPDGMDSTLYNTGKTGAGSSNIAWASWATQTFKDSLINGWMADYDDSNIDRLGHRRWCLNPSMGKTGFGAVAGSNGTYSAMYSFDTSNSGASETGVAWPAQNMPIEYFDDVYPWSVSMGSEVNKDSITVTLTKVSDGRTWTFSSGSADGYFNVNNGNYGQTGCIIFRPDGVSYSAGDSFRVTIDGLGTPVSYTVNFFDESTCGDNENPGGGDGSDDSNTPGSGDGSGDSNTPGSGDSNTPGSGDGSGDSNTPGSGDGSGDSNTPDSGDSSGDNNNSSNNSESNDTPSTPDIGTEIANAKSGDTIKVTGVTSLSNGEMKELLKQSNVTLVMEYTYEGVNYVVTIPSNAAMDNNIPWYGPLYLAAHYGNSAPVNGTTGSTYTVQSRDTLSKIARSNGMTLAQLASKNPQIKDLNRINVGQQINLK